MDICLNSIDRMVVGDGKGGVSRYLSLEEVSGAGKKGNCRKPVKNMS